MPHQIARDGRRVVLIEDDLRVVKVAHRLRPRHDLPICEGVFARQLAFFDRRLVQLHKIRPRDDVVADETRVVVASPTGCLGLSMLRQPTTVIEESQRAQSVLLPKHVDPIEHLAGRPV